MSTSVSSYNKYVISVQEIVTVALAARGKAPNDRLLGVIHCSELGFCGRAIYYCLSEEKPINRIPPDLQLIFDAGHTVHDMIQDRIGDTEDRAYLEMFLRFMSEATEESEWGFHCEVPAGDEDLNLAGHIDGIMTIAGQRDIGIEFKTINKNGFSRLSKPKLEHIWQVHCYMRCTGLKEFRILYYCKDNHDMLEFSVEWDDQVWTKVEKKIQQLLEHHRKGKPPMRPLATPGRICSNCRYQHLCDLSGEYAWQ